MTTAGRNGEQNMQMRRAEKEDMEQLIQLRFAFLEEFRHIKSDVKAALEPELRRYFSQHIGARDFVAVLGFAGEAVACCAFLTVGESPPNDQYPNGRIGYVFNVYTLPQYRKKGYATLLMQELIGQAKQLDVTAINLNASPAGRPIYAQLGFAELSDTAMRLQIR